MPWFTSFAVEPAEEVLRARMVQTQLEARDITDPRVLSAMKTVPRHLFVPQRSRHLAYTDRPLAIGQDQTISQPYIVALMSQLAQIKKGDRVLEIGTGSGYQAAVLAEMGAKVYSMEIVEKLSRQAAQRLKSLNYDVTVDTGDGFGGWPSKAPFDAILVTAAPPSVPEPLTKQLREGGRLVLPVGDNQQELIVVTRGKTGYSKRSVIPVLFVPMTGQAQRRN